MKHTETPWVRDEVDRYHIVCNREKTNLIRIATVNKRFPEAEANRDFIVQAVNSHEALVEACKAAHMFIKNGIDFGFIRMPDDDCPDPAKDVPGIVAAALALAGVKP